MYWENEKTPIKTQRNITEVAKRTGATEFHSSASKKLNSSMSFINEDMRENLQLIMADENEVKGMKENLEAYFKHIDTVES